MADGIQIGEAYVRIRPDTKGFETEAQQSLSGIASGLKSALGALAGAAVFKSGLDELKQQQQVAAQTGAVLKSTAGAANVTAAAISGLAEEIQGYSGKDKEAIQASENLLLTFRHVQNQAGAGNDVFNQAVKLSTDLSVAWGQDLNSSAIQLGKALEDPVSGLTALRRVGVQFSDDQKNLITNLSQSGHQLEAQKIILQELAVQVGGSAEAYGSTLAGKLELAKNQFDDLAAVVVGGVLPAFTGLLGLVQPIAAGFAAMPAPVRDTALAMIALSVASNKLGISLESPKAAAASLKDIISKIGPANIAAAGGIAAGLYAYSELARQQKAATDAGKALHDQVTQKIPTQTYEGLRDQYKRITDQVAGLDAEIAKKNMPWDAAERNNLIEYRNQLVATGNDVGAYINKTQDLATAAGIGGNQAKTFLDQLGAAGIPVRSTTEALALFTINSDGAALAAQLTEQNVATSAEAFKKYGDDVSGVFDSLNKVESSNEAVYQAQKKLSDSGREASSVARDQATAQLDLADAQERLNDLQNQGAKNNRDQRGAALDVKQATLDLADAQKEATAHPGDERAQLRAEQAQLRLEEATQRVADVEKGIQDQSGEIERARLAVASAEDGVADARERSAELPHERAQAEQELTNALIGQQIALLGVKSALDASPGSIQEATDYINALAAAGAISQTQADQLKAALDNVKTTTDGLPTSITMPVTAPGAEETRVALEKVGTNLYRIGDATAYINSQTGQGLVTKGPGTGTAISVPVTPQHPPGAAIGGPAHAGQALRVNELGQPEMFTDTAGNQFILPTTAGTVSNIGDARSKKSFGDVHVTINTTQGQSLSSFTRELDRAAFLMGA